MNRLSQTINSTSVSAHTTLEFMDCQNLTSSHGKLILKIFSYILWSIPCAGPSFHEYTLGVLPLRLEKGKEGRSLRKSPQILCLRYFLTMGGPGLFSDLRLLRKLAQHLPKARSWLKVWKPYETETSDFPPAIRN